MDFALTQWHMGMGNEAQAFSSLVPTLLVMRRLPDHQALAFLAQMTPWGEEGGGGGTQRGCCSLGIAVRIPAFPHTPTPIQPGGFLCNSLRPNELATRQLLMACPDLA